MWVQHFQKDLYLDPGFEAQNGAFYRKMLILFDLCIICKNLKAGKCYFTFMRKKFKISTKMFLWTLFNIKVKFWHRRSLPDLATHANECESI